MELSSTTIIFAVAILAVIALLWYYHGWCSKNACGAGSSYGGGCQYLGCKAAVPGVVPGAAPAPGSAPSEVYSVDVGHYGLTLDAAQKLAASFGATIATTEQVFDAYQKGAQWCRAGWTANGSAPGYSARYPMRSALAACGGREGLVVFDQNPAPGASYAVNLYGPKPRQGAYPVCNDTNQGGPCVMPFFNGLGADTSTRWSMHI